MAPSSLPHTEPTFQSLTPESLPRRAFLLGMVFAVGVFAIGSWLMTIGGGVPLAASRDSQPGAPPPETATSPGPAPKPSSPPTGGTPQLNDADRHRVIQSAIDELKQHHANPETAEKISRALTAHERKGDYSDLKDPAAFADRLTADMRDAGYDQNLALAYTPDGPSGSSRTVIDSDNCGFEKVAILPHNIGYWKLNSFPDPSECGGKAADIIESLNDSAALIFDLRDNHGGFPAMVMTLANFLFDHPEYMYNPRENISERSWTQPVPGSKLTDKPVYILTSAATASAAEHFTYDLKMLKRAIVVGEKTAGQAHAGVFHRLEGHFGIAVPEAKPINPFSQHDWSGVGIEPDVRANPSDALKTAQALAVAKRP